MPGRKALACSIRGTAVAACAASGPSGAAASGYQPAPDGGKLQEALCTDGEWHLVTILGKMRGADGWRMLVERSDGH